MKAEISHIGLHRERHFTGVYQQQGRMLVDRDWNELCDILRHLGTAIGSQAIGTGVPRHGGLLSRPSADPVLVLRDDGGLVAAAGVIGNVLPRRPAADAKLYPNQLDLPAEVRAASAGTTQRLQQDSPGSELYYLDVWERTVTAFDIDDLVDPALHGADTCVRTQRVAQIKAATADDLDTAADPCIPAFLAGRIPAKGNAVFEAGLTPADEAGDECDPCAAQVTIARSVANHLFRLEVHSVGFDAGRRPDRLVLKWSRDNGARELRLAEFATTADPARHSYEYFNDATERLLGMPSDDWADEEFLRGVLDPADPAQVSGVLPRVREWDGWCELQRAATAWSVRGGRHAGRPLGTAARVSAGTLRVQLAETGFAFSLTLAGKDFLAGDYWHALVRARAPAPRRVQVIAALPVGIEHRYCILGTATGEGGDLAFRNLSPHDLRRLQHPSLTCLDASDVGYATDCPSGLFDRTHDTVKKALDRICRIGAEHVAFRKPCTTSVYSQPAADGIRTVADALRLLCNVTAEQIGFAPDCGYLQGVHADTVKKALEALCVKPAQFVPFRPECEFLERAGVRDVAAALNALCNRGEQRQNLPVVKEVGWKNDETMRLSAFKNGITIGFSEDMLGEPISGDVVVVTWEVPLNLTLAQAQVSFPEFLTTQIVPGKISLASQVRLGFSPAIQMDDAAFRRLMEVVRRVQPEFPGIRCRVRLIGRAIFAKRDNRPLDGYVPMVPAGNRVELDLRNPGIGQPSDFESWFYVVEG